VLKANPKSLFTHYSGEKKNKGEKSGKIQAWEKKKKGIGRQSKTIGKEVITSNNDLQGVEPMLENNHNYFIISTSCSSF